MNVLENRSHFKVTISFTTFLKSHFQDTLSFHIQQTRLLRGTHRFLLEADSGHRARWPCTRRHRHQGHTSLQTQPVQKSLTVLSSASTNSARRPSRQHWGPNGQRLRHSPTGPGCGVLASHPNVALQPAAPLPGAR